MDEKYGSHTDEEYYSHTDEEYYIRTDEEHKDLSFYVKPGEIVQIQPEDYDILGLDEVVPHVDRMFEVLTLDNDDEFVKLVTGKHDAASLKEIGLEFSPSLLLSWVLYHRSMKCAQALITGKIGVDVDLNSPITRKSVMLFSEQTPLHLAVGCYEPDFIKLFLNAGARPDVPCQVFDSMMLPIDQVLFLLGKWTDWTPDQCVHVLIFDLWNHCDLIVYLKMISLLLHHSSDELAREILYRYAREVRVIELAVLLYADSIFGVGKFALLDCPDFKALRLSFAEEVAKLYEEECNLADSGNGRLTECISKRQGIMSILLLLEVFERTNFHDIGPDVTVEKLARKFQGACLDLNGTFKYLLKDLPDSHASLGGEKKLDYMPSFLQAQRLRFPKPVSRVLGNEQRTVPLARFFNGKQDSSAIPVLPRPLHDGCCLGPKGEVFAPGTWNLRRAESFVKTLMMKRHA